MVHLHNELAYSVVDPCLIRHIAYWADSTASYGFNVDSWFFDIDGGRFKPMEVSQPYNLITLHWMENRCVATPTIVGDWVVEGAFNLHRLKTMERRGSFESLGGTS